MIIFDLACEHDHPFEGWFESQAAYDNQLERGLVSCPNCGSVEIRRVPSAVHLAKPANIAEASAALPTITTQTGLLNAYRRLTALIISNSEDVGKDFADEARKIHYAQAPIRSIRGEASVEDFESLRDEGIEILLLPSIKKEDLN